MDTLEIKGFKRFENIKVPLNRITLLTGSNGTGKSSVIQSLLIYRNYVEANDFQPVGRQVRISVNDERRLLLGDFDELVNEHAAGVEIRLNGAGIDLDSAADDSRQVVASPSIEEPFLSVPFMLNPEFRYLNAERIGPRSDLRISQVPQPFLSSGERGELAGNALLNASMTFPKLEPSRFCPGNEASNFSIQVDAWMGYIFSDMSVKPERLTQEYCRVVLRGHHYGGYVAAPNTGFGITYALPVIIDGLAASEGSMLIVENPEAHLHPKAQSNIGFFLGMMAAAGVKVLVETHSEHVVNGVRRAVLFADGISYKDLSVCFFPQDPDSEVFTHITMDERGNLSDFPVDFFDQVRQDMLEIMRLGKLNVGHE